MTDEQWKNPLATGLGFIAIVLWSTTISAARGVLEKMGVLLGTSFVFLLSGVLLILLTSVRARGLSWLSRLSPKHLVVCGPLFISYMCLFYLALGIARTRTEAIVVGLINLLWPTMILIFSIPLLGKRPRPFWFVLGLVTGLGGIVLAMSVQSESLSTLIKALGKSGLPMLMALAASVVWGLYSNLARRYPQAIPTGAVALFLLITGGALLGPGLGAWQKATWSLRSAAELAYMAVFPTALAYSLWDTAMRDGNIALLGSSSNLIPVLATFLAGAYLQVPLRWELLGGAISVVLGAFLCQLAFRQKRTRA